MCPCITAELLWKKNFPHFAILTMYLYTLPLAAPLQDYFLRACTLCAPPSKFQIRPCVILSKFHNLHQNSVCEEIGSLFQLYSCVVDADCCNVLRRSRCFLYISTPLHGPHLSNRANRMDISCAINGEHC